MRFTQISLAIMVACLILCLIAGIILNNGASPATPRQSDEGRLETALGVNCINVWTTGNSRIFQCDGGLTCEPMTADQASPDCVTQP
jgi:hypothetical protein